MTFCCFLGFLLLLQEIPAHNIQVLRLLQSVQHYMRSLGEDVRRLKTGLGMSSVSQSVQGPNLNLEKLNSKLQQLQPAS